MTSANVVGRHTTDNIHCHSAVRELEGDGLWQLMFQSVGENQVLEIHEDSGLRIDSRCWWSAE